ncbi:Stringent starvation protein A [Paraconexibacter sp. AEG42_29]|uniref:Stringent starvation protein A n=1 Tax=Paraconexibacter sp. AEG42_29 TaxID=2997339 RepID=A0AAU7AW95_9ACTN
MPSGLILHDHVDSTNALKVRFLLAELGLDAERHEVPLRGERSPDYLAIHPFGLIPALVDGDLVITESNVALRYLAERAGRDDLRGADAAARARIDNLLDTLSLEVRPALWGVEEFVLYAAPIAAADQVRRRAALVVALNAYDALLDPDGPFAVGAFTIADCALGARGKHLGVLGLPDDVAPRLRGVIAAAQARPAYAAALT